MQFGSGVFGSEFKGVRGPESGYSRRIKYEKLGYLLNGPKISKKMKITKKTLQTF